MADSYGEEGGYYVFNMLVDAPEDEHKDLIVVSKYPDSERVLVSVAVIAIEDVETISNDPWDLIPTFA